MRILKKKKKWFSKRWKLKNAIVVKEKEILNEGGLRNSQEFVNHKI